jgi:hypothetical protein
MGTASHEVGDARTLSNHDCFLLNSEQPSSPHIEKITSATPSQHPRKELFLWKLHFLAARTDTHCLSQNALIICFYSPGTCNLLFFIAIRVLDGRPLPNTKIGITPNTIVGLLATFLELSLVVPVSSAVGQIKWLRALRARPMQEFSTIDEASRGPWGILLLLARHSGR